VGRRSELLQYLSNENDVQKFATSAHEIGRRIEYRMLYPRAFFV